MGSDVTVRLARPQELTEIGEITVAAYRADGFAGPAVEDGYARQLRDAARRAEHAELLVAVDEQGAVLGSVTVVLPDTEYSEVCRAGEIEFRMLAVAPAARGRGVGEALTRAVLRRAREERATRVVLCSLDLMRTAHRLYERLGFQRMPERDWCPAPDVRLLCYGLESAASLAVEHDDRAARQDQPG
ncbi:GNAT family N-acetyltransferase [Amycolatopsis cihanbeyliensis]|uniref:Acetyltransferase (GNAT) family protein n=1 Tax=Amycolatopsis cihanbeyliensis TaxID=1128664 RepID=A0A542CUX5_AMYCI|nr:GNAT family N-acetyltransferase [Amycolatopsis cihanbeyliensis]TQI94619.1 acetyltransferase (GNAT) family protein [Amycolatopsis cihanbeyliensis]